MTDGTNERINEESTVPPLTILIMARNEAEVLRHTLPSLQTMLTAGDHIELVADHCMDRTVRVARAFGARTWQRRDNGPEGKGHALRWWLQQTRGGARADEIILILDADSRLSSGYLQSIRREFSNDAEVVQTRIEPFLQSGNPLAFLAGLSEIVEGRVHEPRRARLGWPVRLRGTGMAFRRRILDRFADRLSTVVEDIELSLLLAVNRIPIRYVESECILDPKPEADAGVLHQRARWIKGQLQVVKYYSRDILRLFLCGPAGWSLLGSVLARPKTLFLPLMLSLGYAFYLLGLHFTGHFPQYVFFSLAALISVFVFSDIASIVYSLKWVRDRKRALIALAMVPGFFLLWIKSIILAILSGEAWLRSRPSSLHTAVEADGID